MSGKYENAMLRQVLSVPELLEQVYPDVEPQVRYVLTTPQIFSVKKVVLTSCGDGYAACLAAKRAFERFLQIPIEVVEPLALSRYYQMKWVGESPCDPLVIAVSNSGQVTRVDFKHQHDTPEDAAGHVKSTLIGPSLTFIIENGKLLLGHSQGIYFLEFDGPRNRECYLKILAEK